MRFAVDRIYRARQTVGTLLAGIVVVGQRSFWDMWSGV